MDRPHFIWILCPSLCLLTIFEFSLGLDILYPNQTLADGEVLISPGQVYVLGFFSRGTSTRRFLGIWYKATPDIIPWVANRNNPIVDSQGVLTLTKNGTLLLMSTAQSAIIWSSDSSRPASSPVLKLLDTGNLVLVDKMTASQESHMWQSFDYPGDTRLPGMKMVQDPDTGESKYLTSWKSPDDPSSGEFSYKIENNGLSQLTITKGTKKILRGGFWNGHYFTGNPISPDPVWKFEGVSKRGRLISVFMPFNDSINSRVTMNYSGSLQRYAMNEQKDGWIPMLALPIDPCDNYGWCGHNCICTAYADPYINNESSCLMWFGDLIDMREHTGEVDAGPSIYIRVPLFDLATIAAATNNFSGENMIGEGGFGPVYKGNLTTEQVIAVKRMSRTSGQGPEEFKNEVILIAKLQHRNLVRILGCCIEGEEKMLIYEYMQNKSLDYFIFDQNSRALLTWPKRFDIIMGIARGLLYLHHDSRLKIIHRDLKTSNILLDENLNAKISDFGLARMFEGDQTTARTKKVVGTYGYMAPEYAFDGNFSIKSDVFSMGVVILEIVSGKKNRSFKHPSCYRNLLEQAWLLWKENRELELMDPCYNNSYVESQVKRCIQVGLLCVQNAADDRPVMSSVLLMLSTVDTALRQPKKPGFFLQSSSSFSERNASVIEKSSNGTITMSDVEAR